MPSLQRLKILLQSKKFIGITLILAIAYIILMTKIVTYSSKIEDNTTSIVGNIISYTIDGNKLSMLIKAEEKVQVTYYISTEEEKVFLQENILIGEKVYLTGTLNIPYNNTIPNTFNYKEYLYNNKIYRTFSASKITLSHKTSFFNYLKSAVMRKIEASGSSKAYLYALILGEVDYIDKDVYREYQKNGTTHLFAVSGMHISALALFLTTIFKKMHIKETICNLIIILFLLFYMFLIGFTPSVLRGGLLFIFLLINRKLKLNLKTTYVLYLLFLFLILINPFYIYNLGFIYSFLTSFGLILFSSKITGNYFMKLIKISAIAFLFSFPITIYNFYEINLLTILNNIIIVPFVTTILFPLTLLTFIIPLLEPLLNIGIILLEHTSHFLNYFEINLIVPKINFIFIILYYLGVYLIYKGHFKSIILLIILTISYKLIPYLDSNSYIYFLDVGQGDSTLIIGSNRSYVTMIDTGGKITYDQEEWEKKNKEYDNIDNTITFLKSMGITKIDVFIASHGDYDHIGEAMNLLNKFKVEKIILNNNSINDLEIELTKINKKKKIRTYQNFKELNLGTNTLYFLNYKLYDNDNDNSNIIYLNINDLKILLMGDAGIEVEKDIIKKYNLNNISLLKVGHHGSKTSTSKEFIEVVNPKFSIISVGRNNSYGHPHSEVIQNLKKSNVYRTDQMGSIMFKMKNKKLTIETYKP